MGPRQRRRLTTAAICVVVLAAVAGGLAMWIAHSSSPPRARSSAGLPGILVFPQPNGSYTVMGGGVQTKVKFGMSPHEVQHRLGKPTKTLQDKNGSSCWQYAENLKATAVEGDVAHTVDAARICFVNGSYALEYEEIDGRWDY